jgi:hypothetical protein
MAKKLGQLMDMQERKNLKKEWIARKYALNGLFALDDTKDSDATNTHGKDNQGFVKFDIVMIQECNTEAELTNLYNKYKSVLTDADIKLFSTRKSQLK